MGHGFRIALETAACKVFASEMGYRATHEALQIAGGIGYSKEFPYEQAVRDSRITLIFEGTNEILCALVALMGLQQPGQRLKEIGKAFQASIHSLGAIGSYLAGRVKGTIDRPDFKRVHKADEAELVADQVHDLGRAVERVLRRHGKKIVDRQYAQERLANAAMGLFLATATLSRATSELESAGGDETKVAAELDCARVFVHAAYRRARRSLRALRNNQDKRLDAIAERAVSTKDLAPPSPTDRWRTILHEVMRVRWLAPPHPPSRLWLRWRDWLTDVGRDLPLTAHFLPHGYEVATVLRVALWPRTGLCVSPRLHGKITGRCHLNGPRGPGVHGLRVVGVVLGQVRLISRGTCKRVGFVAERDTVVCEHRGFARNVASRDGGQPSGIGGSDGLLFCREIGSWRKRRRRSTGYHREGEGEGGNVDSHWRSWV